MWLLGIFGGFTTIGKLIAVGSLIFGLLALYGIWHNKVWERGYQRALADIAAQDKKAVDRAKEFRSSLRSCRDGGGVWSQATGECTRR